MKYEFLNVEHKNIFQELREGLAERYRFDKEYLTLCFIMAGNPELLHKMKKYFNGIDGFLESEVMFEEQDFRTETEVLAKLAVHLFNSNESVTPQDFIRSLDDESLLLAVNAILFRRIGLSKDYPLLAE